MGLMGHMRQMGHATNGTSVKVLCLALCAVALGAFGAPYGGVSFSGAVEIDGVEYPDGVTVYAQSWPTQMVVRPINTGGKTFMYFNASGGALSKLGSSAPTKLYPDMQGRVFVTPPCESNLVTSFTQKFASFVYWVDANSGSDTTGDGSSAKPWKTLQHAVDSCANNTLGVIMAKAGVYKEGGTDSTQGLTAGSSWTRVNIPDTKTILIKSESGADETAIEGKPDYESYPSATGGDYGCGSNAYRCVSFGYNNGGTGSAIQGFTLRNGYAGHGGDWEPAGYSGGVLAQRSGVGLSLHQVLDCVISNCSAHSRAALSDVYAFRCFLSDIRNVYSGQSCCSGSYLVSCICEGATGGGGVKGIHNSCVSGWPQVSWNSCGCSFWLGAYEYYGSVMQGGSWGGPIGITRELAIYSDVRSNDYRLASCSKAWGGTVLPERGTTYWTNWVDNYSAFATSAQNGDRIVYVDGVPVSGAVMDTVPKELGVWYVSPDGDDTNNGFAPETPWRTLNYGMYRIPSGDTLRALPGIYAEGVTDRDGAYPTVTSGLPLCRVMVAPTKILESTEGPEKTVIMGAASTDASATADGNGPGAVGCVRMTNSNSSHGTSTLRGFTLTGGHTKLDGNSAAGDNCGGAFFALWSDNEYAILENCIISNNYSHASTHLCNGTLVGCVIADNHPTTGSTAGANFTCLGTLVKNGDATGLTALRNSTIGRDATCSLSAANCVQTLIMGTASSSSVTYTNCVFLSGKEMSKRVDCRISTEEEIAVDENYVPTNRASAVVDFADAQYGPPALLFDCGDARCGQRLYNGVLDVGAVEFDWRDEYTADIPSHGMLKIVEASSNVFESAAQTVTIPSGAGVTGAWTADVGKTAKAYVRITGSGTLLVTVGGKTVATLVGPTSGAKWVSFETSGEREVSFSFTGTGSAELLQARFASTNRFIFR